ncbi:hypothetical protein E2C01_081759 [Portunus trituberculatus]|uniref:Uncharacterized protein n=1 Tax=Portunus trituberculatus TaxID=210409 RepID=A0A5B7IQM5_PORTR|nr:hypothetical protein [Portunus trituberculatus]
MKKNKTTIPSLSPPSPIPIFSLPSLASHAAPPRHPSIAPSRGGSAPLNTSLTDKGYVPRLSRALLLPAPGCLAELTEPRCDSCTSLSLLLLSYIGYSEIPSSSFLGD